MTKRLLACIHLGIFLLNVLGYYGILSGLKELTGAHMERRLESVRQDLGGNITIKVPFALPYEVTSEHFEREGGEFEMDGETFRVIKQRHYNDTLYIVCIRDEQATKINSAIHDVVQSFAGQEDGDEQVTAPTFIKDYIHEVIGLTSMYNGWEKDILLVIETQSLFDSYLASIIQPPESPIA